MSVWTATGYINVARITKTHGRFGEVAAVPVGNLPFCLQPNMEVCLTPPDVQGPRFYTIDRVNQDTNLVHFKDCNSLDKAETLVGKTVLAKREDVPEVVEEQELFDCVGHHMVDMAKGDIGIICELMVLPANDVWRVKSETYGEVLVPVIEDVLISLPKCAGDPVVVELMPGILPECRDTLAES
ncbi:MAG: 16S rRNA processing protein RimM [Coriobacteriales bacterium]|nr:16S rRNA processing protein RimM [Coriobacteriales bacterium]